MFISGDQLSKDLIAYTNAEKYNPSLVRCVSEFATNLGTVQDYRDAQVSLLWFVYCYSKLLTNDYDVILITNDFNEIIKMHICSINDKICFY